MSSTDQKAVITATREDGEPNEVRNCTVDDLTKECRTNASHFRCYVALERLGNEWGIGGVTAVEAPTRQRTTRILRSNTHSSQFEPLVDLERLEKRKKSCAKLDSATKPRKTQTASAVVTKIDIEPRRENDNLVESAEDASSPSANNHLNLRKQLRIGTWNVRTLNNQTELLAMEAERLNMDVLGIVEAHLLGSVSKNSTTGSCWSSRDLKRSAREE